MGPHLCNALHHHHHFHHQCQFNVLHHQVVPLLHPLLLVAWVLHVLHLLLLQHVHPHQDVLQCLHHLHHLCPHHPLHLVVSARSSVPKAVPRAVVRIRSQRSTRNITKLESIWKWTKKQSKIFSPFEI